MSAPTETAAALIPQPEPEFSASFPRGCVAGLLQSLETLLSNLSANVRTACAQTRDDSQQLSREVEKTLALLRKGAHGSRRFLRRSPRFARVVTEATAMTADYRLLELKKRAISKAAGRQETLAVHEANAQRLYDLCVELGGGILKVGQFLSCRMDLLPEAYANRLSLLQDRVPPADMEEVEMRIVKELGKPLAELFDSLDQEPIAAASLGQVHRAKVAGGPSIALKVLRPGIEETVKTDLLALRAISTILHKQVHQVDMKTLSIELSRSVRKELCFKREAANAVRYAETFAHDARIVVPRPLPDFCGPRVIAMCFIEGQRLTDYLDACMADGEAGAARRDALMETLVDHFSEAILQHGFYQADPHPGNFLATDEGKLAVLDFGSMGRLSKSQRKDYIEIVLQTLQRNRQGILDLLHRMGFRTADGESDILARYAEVVLELFDPNAMSNKDLYDPALLMKRVAELSRATRNVKIPPEFVPLGRTLIALGGLIMRYRPNIDFFKIISPHLQAAMTAGNREE